MSFLLRSCSDQKAKQAQKHMNVERKVKKQSDGEIIEKENKMEQREKGDNRLRDLDGNEIENKDIPKKGIQ